MDNVSFHEVGAWDSIFDIVAAAALIEASKVANWSISPIPIGSGLVATRHGKVAVPAPATRKLLQGLNCFDDGIPGERVTPTGAAILKHLNGGTNIRGHLRASGAGFGQMTLKGCSNCVWISIFEDCEQGVTQDRVVQINFEVDDATPEELAVGLQYLRQAEGVLDVIEQPCVGKKGRLVHSVQVLCSPAHQDKIVDACFTQTPTLGLRLQLIERRNLPRHIVTSSSGTRVKQSRRPGGEPTAKADIDDVVCGESHHARSRLASEAVNEVSDNSKA